MDTLEQYILKQLTDTQDELNVVKQENKELKEKLSKRKVEELQLEDLPNSKTITISESPNYYYDLVAASGSTINDLLKDNNKTPDFLKQVLEDEESYNEYLYRQGRRQARRQDVGRHPLSAPSQRQAAL